MNERTYYACSVFGCLNTTKNTAYTFFTFPKDNDIRNSWLKLSNREDLNNKWSTHLRICEAHFKIDDILKLPKRNVLKKGSIPKHLLPTKRYINKETQTTVETTEDTLLEANAADKPGDLHKRFSCKICSGSIVGFRYTCVQCAKYDLCGSCGARGEHSRHYVLRIPRHAPDTEVDAVLSKIRADLLYGLDTEQEEQGIDDGVVPTRHEVHEYEIKVEIKEELPDPLEPEDAFQPDNSYTEPEYTRESTSKEETLVLAPVRTSSTIVTNKEGNYVIIEKPVKPKATQTKPKTKKHKNTTEPEYNGSEKRMKIYLEEQTRVIQALMNTPVDTAGPSTEGASGELPVIPVVKTEEKDKGSFQVFTHTSQTLEEAEPGPVTGKKKATHPARKKKVERTVNIV